MQQHRVKVIGTCVSVSVHFVLKSKTDISNPLMSRQKVYYLKVFLIVFWLTTNPYFTKTTCSVVLRITHNYTKKICEHPNEKSRRITLRDSIKFSLGKHLTASQIIKPQTPRLTKKNSRILTELQNMSSRNTYLIHILSSVHRCR